MRSGCCFEKVMLLVNLLFKKYIVLFKKCAQKSKLRKKLKFN